jgi:hypothetical protein
MHTLQGKIRPTWYVRFPRQSTYAQRTLPTCSPHTWQHFTLTQTELDRFTTPEKKWSRLHLSARLRGPQDPPQFFSQHSHGSSALKPSICWRHATLVYWTQKHQHAISTFNTCLRGPIHRSVTDTGVGYNLGGVCASRPSSYVSVINDNHLVSLMNFIATKMNWGPYIKIHQQSEFKWSISED